MNIQLAAGAGGARILGLVQLLDGGCLRDGHVVEDAERTEDDGCEEQSAEVPA